MRRALVSGQREALSNGFVIYLAPALALPRFLGARGGATTPAVFSSQPVGSGVVVGGADEEGRG